MLSQISDRQINERRISEQEISELVDRFYAKVQLDPEIGPIFNEKIQNWPAHLALLKNFWSTVLLTSTRYKGNPMLTHLQLPLQPAHFRRWLELFRETAGETLSPEHAQIIITKSERIAVNFQAALAARGPLPSS
jgi:hemoglobin